MGASPESVQQLTGGPAPDFPLPGKPHVRTFLSPDHTGHHWLWRQDPENVGRPSDRSHLFLDWRLLFCPAGGKYPWCPPQCDMQDPHCLGPASPPIFSHPGSQPYQCCSYPLKHGGLPLGHPPCAGGIPLDVFSSKPQVQCCLT